MANGLAGRFGVVCAAVGVFGSAAVAQDTALATGRDSLARRMLLSRHPCPNPIPSGWTVADSALGPGARCSLIVAAARGAAEADASRRTRTIDPWNVRCAVFSIPEPDARTAGYGPLWRVAFYADSVGGAEVLLAGFEGNVITVRIVRNIGAPLAQACTPAR